MKNSNKSLHNQKFKHTKNVMCGKNHDKNLMFGKNLTYEDLFQQNQISPKSMFFGTLSSGI